MKNIPFFVTLCIFLTLGGCCHNLGIEEIKSAENLCEKNDGLLKVSLDGSLDTSQFVCKNGAVFSLKAVRANIHKKQ